MNPVTARNLNDDELRHYAELEPAAAEELAQRIGAGTYQQPELAAEILQLEGRCEELGGEADEADSKVAELKEDAEALVAMFKDLRQQIVALGSQGRLPAEDADDLLERMAGCASELHAEVAA